MAGRRVYQIYPRSFADSNGDGVGDLPGATSRLDHLSRLGVDAVWLSPFYVSPQSDGGYDVADYRAVDPVFGTLADADGLIARAGELGLRVIVDIVPNHTSVEHVWFRAALAAGPGSAERARYLFRDGRGADGAEPPNDWQSTFGGPAWTRVVEPNGPRPGSPGQWYLHLFDAGQPDLDWQNPDVHREFEDVLRFWLDRGVAGFRVDVAHGLVKADGLPSWPSSPGGAPRAVRLPDGADPGSSADPAVPRMWDDRGAPPPMWDQDGVHEIYRSWRRVLDGYDGERILVAEAWVQPADRLLRYVRPDEMQQAFNFDYLLTPWRADSLRAVVGTSLAAAATVDATTTWVLSNHDVVRHATRFGYPGGGVDRGGIGPDHPQPDHELGLRRARAATLLMLALPGSAYLYQGEELGLPEHTTLPDVARQDPTFARTQGRRIGRDGCRVPIPWEGNEPSYGFGPGPLSWLPQPECWAALSVAAQDGVDGSTLELYRAALALRRRRRLGAGSLVWDDSGDDDVLMLHNGTTGVLSNTGGCPVQLPDGARVLLCSAEVAGSPVLVPGDATVWYDTAATTPAGATPPVIARPARSRPSSRP